MSPLQVFQGFLASFYRGNVPFVLVVSYRARLFLFPVPCSLFPLYFPLHIRNHLDKSEFACKNILNLHAREQVRVGVGQEAGGHE